MKNIEKYVNVIIYMILIGIIIILLNNQNFIIGNGKKLIKEMTETEQVTNLQKQLDALNDTQTEYANYIQSCKAQIASAMTDMGVTTSNEETLENMAVNIRKIAKGYCFEPVSNFSISASGTKTIAPTYLKEVIGFVCTSTWSNTYGILFLKDAMKYDGSSLGSLKIPSHLGMSITFNDNNSVTLRNGDSTMGCSLKTCYLIGLV